LITAAASDRELRRSLPLGVDVTDIPTITGHLQDAAKRLASVVDGVDQSQLAAVARTVGRQQIGATRPAPLAPLRQLAALRDLGAQSDLQLRPGLRPLLRSAGDRWSMEVNGGTISWPALTGPALELALSGEVFQPRDCADLDPEEQLVVARRLLREGIVVPATAEAGGSTDPDRRTG
jgi:hypothetical protein